VSDDQSANFPSEAEHESSAVEPSTDGQGSGEVVVALEPEGILLGGDPDAVQSYLARIRGIAGHAIDVADIDMGSIGSAGGIAAGLAAVLGKSGQFVQLHPDSVEAIKNGMLLPGTHGFFRMTTIGLDGKFLHQLQWRPVALGPTQMLSIQLLAVQIALKLAIAEVIESIQRVEGKVDSVLKLAEAARAGEVLGHSETVERAVRYLEKYRYLPTADWEAVAGIGPELNTLVQQLRDHVLRTLRDFKADLPVQKRADLLRRALEQGLIGETLDLLVVAEVSLYRWQRLRLARIQATEPDHVQQVIQDAREFLFHQLEEDAALYRNAQRVLDGFTRTHPLEGFRYWSVRGLARDRIKLREDLDAFAISRRNQIVDWSESRPPSIMQAASAAFDVAADKAGRALKEAGSGLARVGDYLIEKPRGNEEVTGDKPDAPNARPN
jgi:hypothetical protein